MSGSAGCVLFTVWPYPAETRSLGKNRVRPRSTEMLSGRARGSLPTGIGMLVSFLQMTGNSDGQRRHPTRIPAPGKGFGYGQLFVDCHYIV